MFAAVVGKSWATAAHPFNLEVNGVDRIASMHFPALSIEMPGPGSNGSMTFTLQDPTASITINEWDEVRFIEHAATRPILFGGFVQSVRYVAWSAAGRSLVVQCVGYGVLLDRKVIAAEPDPMALGGIDDGIGHHVQSLVNRYGGRVSALAFRPGASPTYSGDVSKTMFIHSDWADGAGYPALANVTLREGIDTWASGGTDYGTLSADGTATSIGWVLWVDAYARFHVTWAKDVDSGYEDSLTVDESGTLTVTNLTLEREDTDKATTVRVVGGNAAGTVTVRRAAHARAGDLETLVSQSLSTTADLGRYYADGELARLSGVAVRSTLAIDSNAPLDIRPGQKVVVTSTPLGLSAQGFRITSVGITFRNSTLRSYEVGFGGSLTAPSMSTRSGRFQSRQFTR